MSDRAFRVLMVSSEVDPFARSGGLGDAVGGLSRALAHLGADVVVVTPLYGVTKIPPGAGSWWLDTVEARVGWGPRDTRTLGVFEVQGEMGSAGPTGHRGLHRTCFLAHDLLFASRGLYDDPHGGAYGDNDVRFVTMSRGALAVAERLWGSPDQGGGPDVIHAHDWHAAPAIVSARLTMGAAWARKAMVLTIHNLGFQGVLGFDAVDRLAFPRSSFFDGTLSHDGHLNLLKGAIVLASRVTTVSPTYSREIRTPADGFSLDGLLRSVNYKLFGILNGIDVERFDPRTDGAISRRYDASTAYQARRTCKEALVSEMGLDADGGPLFALISRLTEQKGVDLLLAILPSLIARGARLLFVGTGDPQLEDGLRWACDRYPGRVVARVAFDPPLARRVYSAADFLVVPSRYEPCGLTQLYAMRYGAIPIVTGVGGLLDTVTPIDAVHDVGTGFVAAQPTPTDLLVACEDALTLYRDRRSMAGAVERAMSRNDSWAGSAATYQLLYETAHA
jgi:starch synthase